MSDAVIAALGAFVGVLVTTAVSVVVALVRHRAAVRNDHLRRAFEKHLDRYERVFVSARTVQDSIRNYRAISNRAADRSDPFLFQLLTIATEAAHEYSVAVTWTHNPGMLYLDIKLEERCLRARDLLLRWLAVRRVRTGDVASIRQQDEYRCIPIDKVRYLKPGDYRELRLETRRLVFKSKRDNGDLIKIDQALASVIGELKTVMAY